MTGIQLSSRAMMPSTIEAIASPAPFFVGGGPNGGP
jgi:hypothetical protein